MKILVSLSGGMDSAVVLARAVTAYGKESVEAVGFCYGSKHNRYENHMARQLADHYGVPFDLLDFSSVAEFLASDLLKTGEEIPEGHYEAESMKQTVVPGRNLIFISILSGIAWSREADEIWVGVHAGDHHIYPDCRPGFIDAMTDAVEEGTDGKVHLHAPFLHSTKASIVQEGLELGVPFKLTRTCYKDQPIACGKCGSCQERLEAFEKNGVADPIPYE